MASLLTLSVKLSEEDRAAFVAVQKSCLLPSLSVPGRGEMAELYRAKKREEHKKAMAPYADLLEDELVKMLKRRKTLIYDELLNSQGTSFLVELFSWKTVAYHEPIWEMNNRVAKMTEQEKDLHFLRQAERKKRIQCNGWETTFATEIGPTYGYGPDECESPDYVYHPVKVDRIFRQSDLAMRLALKLGPNFLPCQKWDVVADGDSSGIPGVLDGYTVYKKTLCVRFFPFGLDDKKLKSLLSVAKKEQERFEKGQRTVLGPAEYAVGHGVLNIHK